MLWTIVLQAPLSIGFPSKNTGVGYHFLLQDLPDSGIESVSPASPALRADSLPAEPQGKPKNTGMGSLSPSPMDLPDPGIQPGSAALQVDSLPTELSEVYPKDLPAIHVTVCPPCVSSRLSKNPS